MKPWQKGVPLEQLAKLAEPFRLGLKPYCVGQFALPNERDIADAVEKNSIEWVGIDPVTAAAIGSQLQRDSVHTDFAGREIRLRGGDFYYSRVAFSPGNAAAMISLLHEILAGHEAVWLQIAEEWEELKQLVGSCGFRYVATKIPAASEIFGLYCGGPGAQARIDELEPLDPAEHCAVACMSPEWISELDRSAIAAELAAFAPVWADHYSTYNKRHSWSAFAIRGFDDDPNFIIKPAEMSKSWKEANPDKMSAEPRLTEAAEYFPRTLEIVGRLPGGRDRIRFMRLAEGNGELTRHADITDREAGVGDGCVARVHIPIVTNEEVVFRNWDDRGREVQTHMHERGLFYLDQRKPHAAVNRGNHERIHLVIDCRSSEEIRRMIAPAEEAPPPAKVFRAIPGGGSGKNSAYKFKQPGGGYVSDADVRGKYDRSAKDSGNLTWVTGNPRRDETSAKILAAQSGSGTSIFDPVLCELAYRWFCPAGGLVLDPFAGGSVRGVVASLLGRQYLGVDLRPEQIKENRRQAAALCKETPPRWIEGDSRNIATLCEGEAADFLFSCPPYFDLEVYSDEPRDLSTLDYETFRADYTAIIAASCALLRDNRFACFVVGDMRDKNGMYRGFPWHTIDAFQRAGLHLYNEAVLVTAVGSLPIRAGKQFQTTRKLGKTHQNVLVFVKGDPRKATAAVGDVEVGDLAEFELAAATQV